MAENNEEQRIKLTFDTNAKQSAQDTNALGVSIENVTNSTEENTNAVKQQDATYKTFKTQLREANAELQKSIQLYGETSEQTIKAAKEVANLKDQLGFAKDISEKFNPDQKFKALGAATQIAGTGLQGVTSGMALFGGESEDTQKQLLKVQAAMAFSDAISNLSNLGDQFAVFKSIVIDTYNKIIAKKAAEKLATDAGTTSQLRQNLAVLANPYVIAAAAIAALTVGIYAWVNASSEAAKQEEKTAKAVKSSAKETDKLKESIENASSSAKTSNEIEVLRAKAYGATDDEIRKLIKSQKELSILTAGTDASTAYDNLIKANENVLKASKTGNKELYEEAKENQKNAQQLYKKANEDYNNAIVEDIKFGLETQIELNNKAEENAQKASEKKRERIEKEKEQKKAEKEKESKEANDLAKRMGEKAREDYEKLQQIIKDAKKSNEDSLKTENDLKVEAENARFEAEKQRLLDANLSIEEITIEHKRKIAQLNDEFYASEADAALNRVKTQKEIDLLEFNNKKTQKDALESLGNSAIAGAKDLFAKNKGVQKGVVAVEGAVALGKLAKNTVEAVSKDNATSPLTLGMPWSGIHIGMGVLGAASIISSTNKQLQALGGGSISGGATANIQTQSAPQAIPTVAFNNTAENQIGQSISKAQTEQPPIKVYIEEKEMTDAQNAVKVLVDKNKI